jgi:DNA primase catalytic core
MIAASRPGGNGKNQVDLKALKASVDLLALARSRGHDPKRHGSEKWKIKCPFHDDAEASLVITPGRNLWHCFGCDKGGSAIDFVALADGITTGEAIRRLAEQSGGLVRTAAAIAAPHAPPPRTAQQQTLLNKASEFYHKALFKHPEGRAYLKARGLAEPALLETFRVGYANDTIREAIPPEGELLDDLKAVGILDGQGREHFRDCVVFPIHDAQGNVTGLYGRKVHDQAKVKHLYLPGPHRGVWNRAGARSFKTLLLTEGILDAATLWQAGYKNALACYGTNGLTEDHLQLFRENQTEAVYLVMDGDDAGRQAATRLTPRLKAEGLDVFTVNLPDGEDPNDFFQRHTAEDFDALLKAAGKTAEPVPQTEQAARSGAEQLEALPDGFRVRFTPAEPGKARAYDVRMLEADPRKLRATIKATTPDRNRFHIDTVDLLSARSRKTFIADAAELYREEPAILTLDLNRILSHCEAKAAKPDAPAEAPVVRVTEEQRKEAERYGRRADLLDAIGQDIEKGGFIGERANGLTGYLTMTSRKMDDPLALLILSASGAGKSALQDAALAFCPPEDLVKVTSLTERALFYKDENSLRHKVLALEEAAGAEDAFYALRNLISQKVLAIESTIKDPTTGRHTTMENCVYGPTAVLLTTTRPDVDPETRSRFLITTIDESREQTRRILEAQRKARTLEGFRLKLQRKAIYERHHAFQRLLKPLAVFNPFGALLSFSDERMLMRRDHPKYLQLMDTIAFVRQMQKPVKQMTAEGQAYDYIEVALRDIALANELALEILGKTLDELSGPSRRLLLLIEELVSAKARERHEQPSGVLFTRRELREFTRWSDYQIHHYLNQLVAMEYLVPVAGRNGQQFQYRLMWEGQGKEGERFVLGLKSVEQLRKEANLLGLEAYLLE